jgi:hypothetical protein
MSNLNLFQSAILLPPNIILPYFGTLIKLLEKDGDFSEVWEFDDFFNMEFLYGVDHNNKRTLMLSKGDKETFITLTKCNYAILGNPTLSEIEDEFKKSIMEFIQYNVNSLSVSENQKKVIKHTGIPVGRKTVFSSMDNDPVKDQVKKTVKIRIEHDLKILLSGLNINPNNFEIVFSTSGKCFLNKLKSKPYDRSILSNDAWIVFKQVIADFTENAKRIGIDYEGLAIKGVVFRLPTKEELLTVVNGPNPIINLSKHELIPVNDEDIKYVSKYNNFDNLSSVFNLINCEIKNIYVVDFPT